MKLINFYEFEKLSSLLEEMGAKLTRIKSPNSWEGINDSKLAELINTGEVEIDIDEIKIKDGIFDFKGRKVIVYIRDQYSQYHSRGYKFHLTKCNTISKAFQNRRNSRYVISLRTDGQFKINLMDDNTIIKNDLIEPLKVCKNCLDQINYKKYRVHPYRLKLEIYDNFNLQEYFEIFKNTNLNQSHFKNANNAPLNLYNNNFNLRSKTEREKKGYLCENCKVNLSLPEHKRFAHVHHKDGDKSNDNDSNLEVLCIECHSNQPSHVRLKHSPDYADFITRKAKQEFHFDS
jgi:hypothetical protein